MKNQSGYHQVLLFLVTILALGSSNAKCGSLFDGVWSKTVRQHTDCKYSATANITFTTDVKGVTRAAVDAFPGGLTGKVVGRSYSFNYGFVYGKPTGRGTLSLSSDGKSFSGMFSDNSGHKGTWTGKRTVVPDEIIPAPSGNEIIVVAFDGLWSKAVRKHTDCSFSATSKITFATDRKGVTRATVDGFRGGMNGKVAGRTYTFTYGIVYGKPTGRGSFTLSADGKSFTGTFSDNAGHKGTWSGSR